MKKRLICIALGLALCLGVTPVGAAAEKFPAVNPYPGYADVAESDWFYENAKLCYEVGLMNGTDKGFEPGKALTIGECTAIAARIREALTGETIPSGVPGGAWYQRYVDYLYAAVSASPYGYSSYDAELLAAPEQTATRHQFLSLLRLALEKTNLSSVNDIHFLPDSEDSMVLDFYNWGILTGVDAYGTFAGEKSLTRAEAAAMVSRIVEPSLRLTFTPADYSPFLAAYMEPGTVVFENGVTAEEFLAEVNRRIFQAEEGSLRAGHPFNWHCMDVNGKTTLENTKASVLENLGVTEKQGTQAYKDFDYPVYYSRLIDLTGETLEPDYAVGVGA